MAGSAQNDATPELSVVVPIYHEEACIPELHRRLTEVLTGARVEPYELIFVDDGSTDESRPMIRELAASDPAVRGILLSRHFGQHIAITAGLEHSRGKAVVVLDADLQDPPESIPNFVDAWRDGAHVVVGVRSSRFDPIVKRLFSWLFWRMISVISEVPVPANQAMMRLFSRAAADAMVALGERSRFIAGQTAWIGFTQRTIEIKGHARHAGRTKYTVFKSFGVLLNAVTSFSTAPLRLISYLGWAIAAASIAGGVTLAVLKLAKIVVFASGWPSLFVAISFFSGLTIALMGVIGLYLGRVYQQAMNRPLYFVSEQVSHRPKG